MKSKMRKKLIAFMLCMVLVICNSVSILADAPAAATTTTEKQVKETGTAKSEGASEEEKSADDEKDTSEQSDEESAPETETTEKKEETTEATTEDKEDATTEATTKAKEETTEATETSDKDQTTGAEDDSDKKDKTSETSEEETDKEKTTEAKDETAPSELTYTNDDVVITVSEVAEGAIPEGAELKVVPILKNDADTQTQYTEVEEKIQEKAAETETEIKGFLAYDITFVDEEGNEIEPNSEVKVSIEYKQAAIPAELSEEDAKDTEVSVMHLEEDADGNVSQVVDMGEAGKVDTLETTDAKQVEKVEVKTESFSAFTIIWENRRTVTVHYVDTNGDNITAEIKKNKIYKKSGEWAELNDYKIDIENYTYQGAHINSFHGADATAIRYYDDNWYYRNSSDGYGTRWQFDGGSRDVYLVYSQEIKVHFVSGADGSEIRESMTLEDFFNRFGDGETADLAPEINGYRFVKTKITDTYDQYEGTYNDDTYWALRLRKNNGRYQYNKARINDALDDEWLTINNQVYFIYKPDNYQITTRNSNSDGISLKLFNYDKSIKTKSDAAGFPFYNGKGNHVDGSTGSSNTGGDVKNTLGSNGYPTSSNGKSLDFLFGKNAMTTNYLFKYDASTYSYEYDSQQNHAYYDENAQRFYVYDYTISPADTSDSSFADFEVGNFFPFNDVIDPQRGALNYIQYGRDERTNIDYWFGMSMGMNFYQPADGKLPNGDAMKFEFRGDDDVFVYLDGVLILDLGGIHAAQSGTIDFSTGTIEENGNTIYDGIYKRYRNSGLFTSEELADMFTEITVNGRTRHIFADYKNVDMDFFYLERGAGASNCHIKFNMPPIPDDTIIVGKQITDANASVYSDVEFSFKLETKAEGETDYTTVTNKSVDVYDSAGTYIGKRPVNNEGIFVLKHDERAYFTGYPVTTQYRVTEVGVSSEEYDKVTITGVSVEQINSGGGSSEVPSYRTEDLTVSETPMVVFRNKISAANEKELQITKKMLEDDGNAQYQVKVYFGDDATGEGGEAYQGNYWINEKEYVAEDGIITLTKGQTASIVKIPSGTSFKVVEVKLDTDVYNSPTYDVENADSINTTDAATGKIRLKNDAHVTVTNALKSTTIDLIKYGTQYADGSELSGAIFSLYKGNKAGNTITWEENPFNSEYTKFGVSADGNPELSLPGGYYKLVETKAPTGYQLLDDAIYFQVTNETVQLINGESGEVVNSAEMWELTTSGTITIKIKNNIMVYNLPSAGGPGIYWYTLSGTFLMAGAALIVYKQKRKREVLLRK